MADKCRPNFSEHEFFRVLKMKNILSNKKSKMELTFPNVEVKKLWPELYEAIQKEIKDNNNLPLEKRIRNLLKDKLGADLIRTDEAYKKFFHEVIRFAVNLDTDKMLAGIEYGRNKYGENRHSKGRIPKDDFEDE